jgi:hypothetical protein
VGRWAVGLLSETMNNALTMVGIGFGLVVMLSISTYGLSRIGWSRVARQFPCPIRPDGTRYERVSIWFSPLAQYKQSITVIVSMTGMYFENGLLNKVPASFWHPSFVVPWAALTSICERNFLGMPYAIVSFTIGDCSVSARMPVKVIGDIERCFPEIRERKPRGAKAP